MKGFYTLILLLIFSCKPITERKNSSEQLKNPKDKLNYVTLFEQGEHGYSCFRIPAVVVTNSGSILAFAEARKNSCSDTGNIDLVMRKSDDNGATWSDLKIIWDDGENVCGNPSPVVDEETGDIHLLSTWNHGADHESRIIDETSKFSREVFHIVSNDDGNNWSVPRNITKSTKLANWTWYATGPVHGIQMKKTEAKGRLIIPCDHIESQTKKYFSHVIYSDDHGQTWELGGTTPRDQVNECTIAELENGALMLNMRNYKRADSQSRQVAISNDGGLTWQDQHIDESLPEPRCQGALLNVDRKGKNVLLFTNPAHLSSRENMTLSISRDNGESWDENITLFDKNAAYSDLAELNNGQIFILFEAGLESAYDGIHYKTVSVQ